MKNTFFLHLILLLLMTACHSNTEISLELIPVKSGEKYGYINAKGEYVINPQFNNATFFRGDLALVRTTDMNYGYINKKGLMSIPAIYEDATVFKEGIAWVVKSNGAPSAINTNGETLFTLKQAEDVCNFSDGLAQFSMGNKYGYVNKKGEVVIPAVYTRANPFSEGLAAVSKSDKGGYGYINKSGDQIIKEQFSYAEKFIKGKAIVLFGTSGWGTIDKKGKYIINPQFRELNYDGDRYIICLQGGKEYGYCDAEGKIIINPQFEECNAFGESKLAPVKINDKYGYIDEAGKIVINPQFNLALPFLDKSAFVQTNGKIGTIDKDGHYVINPQFSDISADVIVAIDPYSMKAYGAYNQVQSEFFDVEYIATKMQEMITANAVNGMSYASSLNEIMAKYSLTEGSIKNNTYFQKIAEIDLCQNASLVLSMRGEFFDKVSDGWWGYNYLLKKGAIPTAYKGAFLLKNKGEGKEDTLFPALLKAFGVSDNGSSTRELKIGNHSLTLEKDNTISFIIESGNN